MKRTRFLLAAVIAMLALNSCKKNDVTSNPSTNISFLKVGNKWVYNVTGGFTSYTTTTNEIVSTSGGIYKMATKFDDTPGANAYLYGENGYLCWYDEGQGKAANQQVLKYVNTGIGDSWIRKTPSETYHHVCESLNDTITVPAGTFVCKRIKITFENAFNDQTTWWNDQYGQIKVDNLFLSVELASKNF